MSPSFTPGLPRPPPSVRVPSVRRSRFFSRFPVATLAVHLMTAVTIFPWTTLRVPITTDRPLVAPSYYVTTPPALRGHPDCLPLQLLVQAPFTTLLLTNFATAPVRLSSDAFLAIAEPVDCIDDLSADPDLDLDHHGPLMVSPRRPPPDDVRIQSPYLAYISETDCVP